MTATLFDLKPYHQELPPDPNAPLTAKEMIECLSEAEEDRDRNRLLWLFLYLCRHGESYSEANYRRIFDRHSQAEQALDRRDRVDLIERAG